MIVVPGIGQFIISLDHYYEAPGELWRVAYVPSTNRCEETRDAARSG